MFGRIFKIFVIIHLFGAFGKDGEAAEILACLSSASRSHHIIQTTILEELARKGHNLTVLSTFPVHRDDLPDNYHHIYLKLHDNDDWLNMRHGMLNNETKSDSNQLRRLPKVLKMIVRRSKELVNHEIVQNLMKSDQKFDLYILGYNINEMMLGLAGHFKVPSVLFSTLPAMKPLRDLIGNPASVSSAPIFSNAKRANEPLSFFQRLGLFVEYTLEFIITTLIDVFVMEKAYYEIFNGTATPTFDDVKKNVSLILTNYHFSEGMVRPALPSLVEVGGIHISDKVNPLPEELQKILDSANEHGVILFSFGGNIKSSDMTDAKIQMFYRVFSRLKQKIIWKWESDEIPDGKPANVHMRKWIPQIDLLAQPQIKFFLSHCGTGGVYEAKYYGVPILGLPIYGDQLAHAKRIAGDGWAKILNIDNLTESELEDGVNEMLTNPLYGKTAKKMSQLFRDRPMTPLQTATYWIEYVIRHDGAKHMQSSVVHLNFFQKTSLDVIAVLLFILFIILWFLVKVICFISKHRILVVMAVSMISYFLFIFFD